MSSVGSFIGQKFNSWTILELAGVRKYTKAVRELAKVRCDCGVEGIRDIYSVVYGHSTQCRGCMGRKVSFLNLPKNENPRWRSEGAIPARLIGHVRSGARSRNIEYNLPEGYLSELWNTQAGKCALTGIELVIPPTKRRSSSGSCKINKQYASLDRINSSLPYVICNVRWVCAIVNVMKNSLSDEDFIHFCTLVARHINPQ